MVHLYKQLNLMGSLLVLISLCACNPKLEEGDPIVIDSISPSVGQLSGEDTITIEGSGLGFVETIYLGTELCTNVQVFSGSKVTCETPAQPAGTVDLTINGKAKKSTTLAAAFTYQIGPSVTSISPTSTSTAGGGTLTITGTGFIAGATVYVGGVSCPVTSTTAPTSIQCTIPARSVGPKPVIVVNPDSQTVTYDYLTFVAPPTISSVSPIGGALAGGTTVTLYGTGFTNTSTVSIGSASCSPVTFITANAISCVTSGHAAGAVNVVVTNPDSQTGTLPSGFLYRLAPTITSLSATAGSINGGTYTVITGTGFEAGSVVKIGSVACVGNGYVSSTIFNCSTGPNSAGTYTVSVTNTDGQSGTLASGYTYRPAPTVTSVSPSIVPAGVPTLITITGTGFVSGATVKIGALTCSSPLVASATSMTCTTPINSSASYNVRVTNSDSQFGNLASGIAYQAAPTVTLVNPNVGDIAGGTSVTITGTGFLTGASVTIGSVACTGVALSSPTTITCTTSSHAHGVVSAVVTNTDLQSGAMASAFTYQIPATLAWDTSGSHPANPDSYGTTTTNVTHTYYLTNTGDVTTSGISISLTGANASNWTIGTDNCSSATLAAAASCTVDVTFQGLTSVAGTYTANVSATATSGGTVANVMNATRGP